MRFHDPALLSSSECSSRSCVLLPAPLATHFRHSITAAQSPQHGCSPCTVITVVLLQARIPCPAVSHE
jgi:hypothetical protein